jgi:hypothetical protein
MVYNNHNYCFWTFSIVRNSKQKNTTFRKRDLFPSSDEGRETAILLGCLERANLNHWTTNAEVEVTLWLTVSMSWHRVPLWDLRPDIISCRNVAVWNLRSCIYWAPSLTRGRVCNLQCNHSIVRVARNPKPYFTVSSETPPAWRVRFPYLYPAGTGWPSYTPGHWEPFTSSFTTRKATVEVF